MKILGLTGGLGMGKSAAAGWLVQRSLPVVDADLLARQAVEPGQPALREIQQTFGPDVIAPDGRLRRAELARRVFSDDARRRQLEAILHPRIREAWKMQVHQWQLQGQRLAIVVIPLLFETRAETEFDAILCVACSPPTQQQRLRSRGWTAEQIEQRNRAQWPIAEKMARAHFVLWNEAGLTVLGEQLERVMRRLSP